MILVDSNVILDILTKDPAWYKWSASNLEKLAEEHMFIINPIIYAEVSIGFEKIEAVEAALPSNFFERHPITEEVAFLAGKAFVKYKKNLGKKTSLLSDFLIGAHAAVLGIPILTRDNRHYETYFPKVELITP